MEYYTRILGSMCGVARTKVGTLAASVQPREPVSSDCKMRVCMMMGGRIYIFIFALPLGVGIGQMYKLLEGELRHS